MVLAMTKKNQTIVSILGSSYFQPIANLVDRWFTKAHPKTNSVQSGYYEHGYAASVIILLIAMFESYIVRVRYLNSSAVPEDVRSAIYVLKNVYPKFRCFKALTDVYVLRDVLFHNHLWEIDFSWGGPQGMLKNNASLHPSFGDKKYRNRVNQKSLRTKAIGLSVIPTKVNRTDARKVFQTIWKCLLFLENKDFNQCSVSHTHVWYRKKNILFGDLIEEFKKAP